MRWRRRTECPFIGECEREVSMRHYERYCSGAFKRCPFFKVMAEERKRMPSLWQRTPSEWGGERRE